MKSKTRLVTESDQGLSLISIGALPASASTEKTLACDGRRSSRRDSDRPCLAAGCGGIFTPTRLVSSLGRRGKKEDDSEDSKIS